MEPRPTLNNAPPPFSGTHIYNSSTLPSMDPFDNGSQNCNVSPNFNVPQSKNSELFWNQQNQSDGYFGHQSCQQPPQATATTFHYDMPVVPTDIAGFALTLPHPQNVPTTNLYSHLGNVAPQTILGFAPENSFPMLSFDSSNEKLFRKGSAPCATVQTNTQQRENSGILPHVSELLQQQPQSQVMFPTYNMMYESFPQQQQIFPENEYDIGNDVTTSDSSPSGIEISYPPANDDEEPQFKVRELANMFGFSKDAKKHWRFRDLKRALVEKISPEHQKFIENHPQHSSLYLLHFQIFFENL